jgi:threonine synthase
MMDFKKQCLYCSNELATDAYTCTCKSEPWFSEYRVSEIQYTDPHFREKIRHSYEDYDLKHEKGILQYAGLPNVENATSLFDTIGNTELFQMPELSKQLGAKIYVKNEGNNPSGCFKDRETVACFLNAKSQNIHKAVIYSSGNAAASAALFAQFSDIKLVTFVPGDTYDEKIDYIRDHGAHVIVVGDEHTSFEEGYRIYSSLAASGFFRRANIDDWSVRNPFRVEGDKTTSLEIIKQLQQEEMTVPDFVLVPSANGSCLAGMWKGFKELYKARIINKLPHMVSVGINDGSPIYKAVQKKETLKPVKRSMDNIAEKDAEMGSIILAEEGYDSIEAAKAVIDSNGSAYEVGGGAVEEFYNKLLSKEIVAIKDHELLPEPASLISLAAIPQLLKERDGNNPLIISVMTGHGMKAKSKVQELVSKGRGARKMVRSFIRKKRIDTPEMAENKGRRINTSSNLKEIKSKFQSLIDRD